MKYKFKQDHVDSFVKSLKPAKPLKPIVTVRIKVNGEYITTCSGKTIWRAIGHAKNALRNHFGYSDLEQVIVKYNQLNPNHYDHRNIVWQDFIQYLQDIHVLEFEVK